MTTRVEGSIGRSSPDPSGSGSMSGSESLRSRSTSAATDSNSLAAIDPDDPQKPSEAAFANARASRPEVCGSYAPERPYPIYLRGLVERGFGRGGKDLGCPTANLPSKVLQTQSLLQRTGVYYGFARILPQDPDDPDLADEAAEGDGEAGLETMERAGASSAAGTTSIDGVPAATFDDDVDLNYDEDGDELILSASPVHEADELVESNRWRDSAGTPGATYLIKPRQLSRSSARSSRSVKTLMEKAGNLDLERSTSSQSAATSHSGDSGHVRAGSVSGGHSGMGLGTAAEALVHQQHSTGKGLAPAAELRDRSTEGTSAVSADKHPRSQSGTSSQTGSLRRKKKRRVPITSQDARVFPMVMSVGWNPFYNNTTKTAEVHVLHKFAADFYGLEMRVVVLGYIRPEYNYVSKEALIDDIEMDKHVALKSLARNPYQDYVTDPFLMAPS